VSQGTKTLLREVGVSLVGALVGALVTASTLYPRVTAVETDVRAIHAEVGQIHQDVRELRAETLTRRGGAQ
jgi:hypothetical protein